MSLIKTPEEIKVLREGGHKLASVLSRIADAVRPGISTADLDTLAEDLIRKEGGESAFKGYKAFGAKTAYPGTVCTSINEEVVHGIPSKTRILAEGDIIGLDIGMKYGGLYTDTAVTVPVGTIDSAARELIFVTNSALTEGIRAICAGAHVGDIGNAIETYVRSKGMYGIVKDLVGHGVGHAVHEDPPIPNYRTKGRGPSLVPGMVLALEPMLTLGAAGVMIAKDHWTWSTRDGSLSAHFEHTILVTKEGAEILTKE
ncbi:MAG: type I methionyl aminopeptidase [Candidatus Ryanbacteria bacterium CG10_big_fil_rev_8_21_14_0_10_43_42]|uniref:Methionine aminopeptidase n=1 Tax=Candidatus Ryanbacteria bacterium CG10_big_fil_rev_8_21_14_0_10_43_42 TaxID=1974864 RepID=A0A2M8KY36_9BACT|nr:MAG: type I methionyl aminopeptidase [Candidatus Ryanbacteria bacterium CG10_big_fil_rev_8_21_14_0_10_43_42]